MSTSWRSRIWNEEIQNTHCSSHSISGISKTTNTGSQSEQAQRERIHLRSWLIEQLWRTYVPHQALMTSSSRKPSSEVGMLRNTREDTSIPGNVFDRQHAQRDSDELHKYSRNLAISLAILRAEGIENSGSEEPLRPIPCFSIRARRNSPDDKKVWCLWLTMPWVLGLALNAWQFRVISPRRCICKNSLTKRNFKAGSWISKLQFAQKRKISRSYCSGSRDRSNQLAEGPHQSIQNHYGKRILWLWRIGFDDGGSIEMVLRYCLFDPRNYRA